MSEIKSSAAEIRTGLLDVDRTLADKGFAAPALAFTFAFVILFREGVEVVLLLAILLGALSAGRASGYRKPLAAGVIAALAATALTWVLATVVLEIAPVQRELLEGITAVLAVVVLFVVSFWLVSRLDHKHWLEFMRARVASAIAAGSAVAFAGLGFTAVYREGFETVLFYQALSIFAAGPRAVRRARLRDGSGRARRGRLHGAEARPPDPGEADAHRRRRDAAAALGHVRRQRRPLAAGGRLGLDHTRPVGRRAAADLPRRADRHPSDARGPDGAGGAAVGLHARRSVGLRDQAVATPRRRRRSGHERADPDRRRRRRNVHQGRRHRDGAVAAAGAHGRPDLARRQGGRRRGRRRRAPDAPRRARRGSERASRWSPSRRRRR